MSHPWRRQASAGAAKARAEKARVVNKVAQEISNLRSMNNAVLTPSYEMVLPTQPAPGGDSADENSKPPNSKISAGIRPAQ